MNLNRFIENLQHKPKIVRVQILVGAVFICMLFVIWIWAISLNLPQEASLHPAQNGGARGVGQASGESTLEQLEGIGQEAFKSLENFKKEFSVKEFEELEQSKAVRQEEVEPVRLPVE